MGKEYERDVLVLGSVPSLGRVVVFDDMEGFFKWKKTGTGGDEVIEKDSTEAYNGSNCLHVKTRVTDPAELDYVKALRWITERPGRRYRIELLWYYVSDSLPGSCWFDFDVIGAGKIYSPGILYLPAADKWQYRAASGFHVDLPDGAQKLEPAGWHRVMFEADLAQEKYIRMVCDHLEVDMKTIPLLANTNTLGAHAKVSFRIETADAAAAESYYDDVLVMEI